MRDSLLVVVLLVAVVGALGFLWPRSGLQNHLPWSSTATAAATVPASPAARVPTRPVAGRSKVHPRTPPEQIAETVAVIAAPAPPESARTPEHLAPSELKEGLKRAEVYRLFGNPDLKTTFLSRGNLLEDYIYLVKAEGRSIVASLKNGKVEHVSSANGGTAVDIH